MAPELISHLERSALETQNVSLISVVITQRRKVHSSLACKLIQSHQEMFATQRFINVCAAHQNLTTLWLMAV